MTRPVVGLSISEKAFHAKSALVNVHIEVNQGEIVSLVGPSGCGKSTLLRIICGLDTDYRGSVEVLGHAPRLHSRDVGFIFQEPRLLPWLTVAENVGFELGRKGASHPRVSELLSEMGMLDSAAAYPKQLSGGMAQRAAIARGLFTQPALLLLDEPFSAVDAFTRMRLQDLLLSVASRHGITLLMVTHDIAEAVYLSDRVAVLSSSPGQLRGEIRIELPRPRDRLNASLPRLAGEVLRLLDPPAARILPQAGAAECNPSGPAKQQNCADSEWPASDEAAGTSP